MALGAGIIAGDGSRLTSWNADSRHAAVIARLRRQLGTVCSRLDAADGQRATCEGVLKNAPA